MNQQCKVTSDKLELCAKILKNISQKIDTTKEQKLVKNIEKNFQ